MTKTHPSTVMRVLHVALPTLFLTMSTVFVAVPYQIGQWPGKALASLQAAIPGFHLS